MRFLPSFSIHSPGLLGSGAFSVQDSRARIVGVMQMRATDLDSEGLQNNGTNSL